MDVLNFGTFEAQDSASYVLVPPQKPRWLVSDDVLVDISNRIRLGRPWQNVALYGKRVHHLHC